MPTIFATGGPWFVARRANSDSDWQMNEQGFSTEAKAKSYIAAQDPNYEYSWINISDVKPTQVNRTTGTKQ